MDTPLYGGHEPVKAGMVAVHFLYVVDAGTTLRSLRLVQLQGIFLRESLVRVHLVGAED